MDLPQLANKLITVCDPWPLPLLTPSPLPLQPPLRHTAADGIVWGWIYFENSHVCRSSLQPLLPIYIISFSIHHRAPRFTPSSNTILMFGEVGPSSVNVIISYLQHYHQTNHTSIHTRRFRPKPHANCTMYYKPSFLPWPLLVTNS